MPINYRNIEDKRRLIHKLAELYGKVYDIRLCQLISNLKGLGVQDLFFLYDDDLEKLIDEELESRAKKSK